MKGRKMIRGVESNILKEIDCIGRDDYWLRFGRIILFFKSYGEYMWIYFSKLGSRRKFR